MKARTTNTDETAFGNAVIFPATGFAPMLFLEFIAEEKFNVDKLQKNDDWFMAHFAPSKEINEKCASYINANI